MARDATDTRARLGSSRVARASGQATAEFGLVVTVLVLMMLAVVDFGRLVAMQSAVVTASREAARYGSAVGTAVDASPAEPRYAYCTGIRNAARAVVGGLISVADGSIAVSYDTGTNGVATTTACPSTGETPGPVEGEIAAFDRVVVEVSATYSPISPVRALVPSITVVSIDRRAIVK